MKLSPKLDNGNANKFAKFQDGESVSTNVVAIDPPTGYMGMKYALQMA